MKTGILCAVMGRKGEIFGYQKKAEDEKMYEQTSYYKGDSCMFITLII